MSDATKVRQRSRWRPRGTTRLQRIAIVAVAILGMFVLYEIASSFIAYTDDAYVQSGPGGGGAADARTHHRRQPLSITRR